MLTLTSKYMLCKIFKRDTRSIMHDDTASPIILGVVAAGFCPAAPKLFISSDISIRYGSSRVFIYTGLNTLPSILFG